MSQTTFRFIRRPEFQHLLGGISRAKFEGMIAEGILPKPYKLGKRTVAWRSDEVDTALASMTRIDDAYMKRTKPEKTL